MQQFGKYRIKGTYDDGDCSDNTEQDIVCISWNCGICNVTCYLLDIYASGPTLEDAEKNFIRCIDQIEAFLHPTDGSVLSEDDVSYRRCYIDEFIEIAE